MQRLVDTAVVVVAVIIPPLQFQSAQESVHRDVPSIDAANAVRL